MSLSAKNPIEAGASRRDFLASALAAAALSAWPATAGSGNALAGESRYDDRIDQAIAIRLDAAKCLKRRKKVRHLDNGDLAEHGPASAFSKSLPHDARGEVDARAMKALDKALRSGRAEDFEQVPLGGKARLANPQASLCFDLLGPDATTLPLAPPPRLASRAQTFELAELYWQALLRDVPFSDYESDPRVARAAAELAELAGEPIDASTVFRGRTAGDRVGPYVSQFLLKDLVMPPIRMPQKIRTCVAGDDYLKMVPEWLAVQNGGLTGVNRFEPEPKHLRNGRDLAEYVHRDIAFQGPMAAALMLLRWGVLADGGNPYKHSRTQSPFTTFGSPYLLYLIAAASQASLTSCWFQKWQVHRRQRPEEVAGRVEGHRSAGRELLLDPAILNTAALGETLGRQGNVLLSCAYPEGSPIHPAYPAGHAVIAGAGVTILKAFFDESALVPEPVVPSADGASLKPWKGAPLTVGGELDKLAANLGVGRNIAGVHWRSDVEAGQALGEETAIELLRQSALTGNEIFGGFSLRRFDGKRVTV